MGRKKEITECKHGTPDNLLCRGCAGERREDPTKLSKQETLALIERHRRIDAKLVRTREIRIRRAGKVSAMVLELAPRASSTV